MFPEICRICGTNDALQLVGQDNVELLEKLKLCTNIIINFDDSLPKHICRECNEGLEISNRLRQRGAEMEKKLKLQLAKETSQPLVDDILAVEYLEESEEEYLEEQAIEVEDKSRQGSEDTDQSAHVDVSDANFEDIIEIAVDDDDDVRVVGEPPDEESLNVLAKYTIDMVPHFSDKIESIQCRETLVDASNYSCGTCEQMCSTQTEYRQHIQEHGARRFNCIQCNKWFPTRYRLYKHETCHSTEAQGRHQCTHCERCYRTQSNLVRHMRAAHEQRRQYTCTLCLESFGRSDVLKTHMLTHKHDRDFACSECDQCFKSQRYLESHMRIHLPKAATYKQARRKASVPLKKYTYTYTCEYCGKISTQLFTHKNHLLTHTKERPYACQTCAKQFRTLCALTTHERVHTGQRPYKCEQCAAAFRQLSHLKDHVLIHKGVTPHLCDLCNMAFTKKSNMLAHKRRHINAERKDAERGDAERDCERAHETKKRCTEDDRKVNEVAARTISTEADRSGSNVDALEQQPDEKTFLLTEEATFDEVYFLDDVLQD